MFAVLEDEFLALEVLSRVTKLLFKAYLASFQEDHLKLLPSLSLEQTSDE